MARALIPSFLNTLIPTSNSLLISKLATTVVKLTRDLFDKLSLLNGASPKFSIIKPWMPPSDSALTSF